MEHSSQNPYFPVALHIYGSFMLYLFIHIDTNNWGLKVPAPHEIAVPCSGGGALMSTGGPNEIWAISGHERSTEYVFENIHAKYYVTLHI